MTLELERRSPAPLGGAIRRAVVGELHVRAGAGDEHVIEGMVIPFGQVATVRDAPNAPAYREAIARGATDDLDPSSVLLEYTPAPNTGQLHQGAVIVGRGFSGEARDDGHHIAFRVARSAAGNDAHALADAGVLRDMSIVFDPVAHRQRADGVIERTRINVRRVALLEDGAYPGAQVTAVRSASEGTTVNCPHCGAALSYGVGHTCAGTRAAAAAQQQQQAPPAPRADDDPAPEQTPPPPAQPAAQAPADPSRPLRAHVSVELEAQRAQAERDTAAALARSAPRASLGATITREQAVYGPGSGQSFYRDAWQLQERGARGSAEAGERLDRHYAMLNDLDIAYQRALGIMGLQRAAALLERAGEVLSSEIPGAYPSEYLPGLLVPRLLKQRPMGGFYSHVPLSDGRPRIYPVVSTSTSVAVQSAEGANPAASDFGTTATTVTPLLYGGETLVSRQVLDGADPSIDAMLSQDLGEAYLQASEAIVRAAVEAGSTASGVTLTAATPNIGLIGMYTNHIASVFIPPERLFLPTTLTNSWLTQLDTTNRPIAPGYGPTNTDAVADPAGVPIVAQLFGMPVAQSWSSTAGAGAGVGGVAVIGRESDFAIFESALTSFDFREGAGAPASIRIGVWAYLVVGTRRGSRKATGA